MNKRLNLTVKGNGPDLVLIHGWGMNSGIWQHIIAELAPFYRVHIIDLPGHGHTPLTAAKDFTLESIAQALLAVLPSHAIYIGWSLGSLLCNFIAAQYPQRVAKLVAIAATPKFTQSNSWRHGVPAEQFERFANDLSINIRVVLEAFLALQVRRTKTARTTLMTMRQHIFASPLPHPDALAEGLNILRYTDMRLQLKCIEVPLLWVLGERDPLVPITIIDELAELSPLSEITVIPGAGHAPFVSHTENFIDVIMTFLSDNHA